MKPKLSLAVPVEACSICKFYRPPPVTPTAGGIVRSGWCRRYPASEQKQPDEWCGEYKGMT